MKLLIRNIMISNSSNIGELHKIFIKQFRNELLRESKEKGDAYITHNLNTLVQWVDSLTEMFNKIILTGEFYKLSSMCNSVLSCSIDKNKNINNYSIIPDNIGKFMDKEFIAGLDDIFEAAYLKMIIYVHGYLNKIIIDKMSLDMSKSESYKNWTLEKIYDKLTTMMDKYKTTITYTDVNDREIVFESKNFIDIINMIYTVDIKKITSFSAFDQINNVDDILNNDQFFIKK